MADYIDVGTLYHVGYWKGPYGNLFPVFEWSECLTYDVLASTYHGKANRYVPINHLIPRAVFNSTLYGDMLSAAEALVQSNAVSINTTELIYFGDNIIDKKTVVVNNSSGIYAQIYYLEHGTSYGVNVSDADFKSGFKDSYVGSAGDSGSCIILKVDRNGKPFLYRCCSHCAISSINSNTTNIINFVPDANFRHGLDFLFGIKALSLEYTPDGEYFDGTILPPVNPYEPGGESGEGGGGGTFDESSDPIPIPTIPTLSSSNTGFTRIYNPTLAQVQDLARYLWTDESVIQTIWNHIKQFFENPMDAIIGFNLVPVPVPDGGVQNFALMYIDTGVSMTVAASQFVDVDCGTLDIEPYYGSALDYSPYTKVSCFLPFIGTVSLNVDEVMGRTLAVKYRVDICSGSCVAYITVDGNAIYQFSGHCAISIPLSQADFSSYVNAAISVAKLAGAAMLGAAGGGAAAAASEAAQTTSETTTITNTARNPSTGRQITTGTQVITSERTESTPVTKASFAGLTPQNVSNTVGEIMNAKPHIEHSGSFSGNSGYLGVRRPFVIIERPNMCMPANYQALNGFPAMITMSLGSCKGYTRVQQVQLTGLHATNPEQAEILQLLKSGVIL